MSYIVIVTPNVAIGVWGTPTSRDQAYVFARRKDAELVLRMARHALNIGPAGIHVARLLPPKKVQP